MGDWIVLALLVPLLTATLCVLAWRRIRVQRWISGVGSVSLLAVAITLNAAVFTEGILVTQLGDWPAPFGISLVADRLAAIMVLMAGLCAATVGVYSLTQVTHADKRLGFHPLFHFLLFGVCAAFLTGDLFNLFVSFEVMLLSSFVLLGLGGRRSQMEGAVKYVTLNLISSALFLTGLGVLYGKVGSLNMAHVAEVVAAVEAGPDAQAMTVVSLLFLVSFGIKAAVFPVFFWLPASYHTPSPAVSAIFAGLLTKVGVYALIRAFTLIFVRDVAFTHTLLLVIGALTMIIGVLGATAQMEIRRILSFHIVSQIGYMIVGLALFTPFAIGCAVFYVAHHIIVKTNLFLVGGLAARLGGTEKLKQLHGLYARSPILAALFLIPALSLAGMPPLSGFFAKLGIIKAGVADGTWQGVVAVVCALAAGLLTLFSMLKIWNEAFWKVKADASARETPRPDVSLRPTWLLPSITLATITVAIGLGVGPLLAACLDIGEELQARTPYIEAVLGPEPSADLPVVSNPSALPTDADQVPQHANQAAAHAGDPAEDAATRSSTASTDVFNAAAAHDQSLQADEHATGH